MSDRNKYRPFGSPSFGAINNLQILTKILATKTQIYENGDVADQRDAIADCLNAVVSYLSEQNVDLRLLTPLIHTVETLSERENNRLDPIFCTRDRASRPSRSLVQNQEDGLIAALANHWLKHNLDPSITHKKQLPVIARLLKRHGLCDIKATRITQARELVAQESSDHSAIVMCRTVEVWLDQYARDYGPQNAIAEFLPLLAQFPGLFKEN